MENESKSAAQRTVDEVEGMRNRNAVTTAAMAIAKNKDIPREPVGILTQFKFISYPFDGSDVFFPDFLTHLSDVDIHGTSQYKDIRSPNVMQ